MRIIYKTGILCILLFALLPACHKKPDATDSFGHAIYLSDYKHKWLIVNYWATWCTPCLVELPELNSLANNYPKQVAVLGISFDQLPKAAIKQLAKRLAITFPMLSTLPYQKFKAQAIATLPTTLIFDPKGQLFKTCYGPQTAKSLATLLALHKSK